MNYGHRLYQGQIIGHRQVLGLGAVWESRSGCQAGTFPSCGLLVCQLPQDPLREGPDLSLDVH